MPQAMPTTGGEMPAPAMDMAEEMTGAAAPVAPTIRRAVPPAGAEPQVLVPVTPAPHPAGPVRVRIAELQLGAGGTFRPPAGPCQDVLVYVRAGELRAAGTGVASPQAPATLYPGDAVRFGAEGDGLLQNLSARPARTVVAFVRADDEPRFDDPGPDGGPGCLAPAAPDPLVRPSRAASARTTEPLTALDGALRIRILLDQEGEGARHGGLSVLEGDPDLAVPQHRHPEAAELLYVEDGTGSMQVGERRVRIAPGVAVYVPPGVLHDYRGDGGRPLRAIQVYSPSGPEQRYR